MISLLDGVGALAALGAVLLMMTSWRYRLATEEKWLIAAIGGITAIVNGVSFQSWLGVGVGGDISENVGDYLQILQPIFWGMFFYVVLQSAQRRALEKSRQQMRDLVENMPVILHAYDAEGRILAWNRRAEEVSGFSKEEVMGDNAILSQLFPDADYREQLLQECRLGGRQLSAPYSPPGLQAALRTSGGLVQHFPKSTDQRLGQLGNWSGYDGATGGSERAGTYGHPRRTHRVAQPCALARPPQLCAHRRSAQ
ncbi:MAG: PAS domain S-box protein [Cellvibrionaceae bacterium]|nr:PAS domain S-box protein [Cellvibrionaceae bacterium]